MKFLINILLVVTITLPMQDIFSQEKIETPDSFSLAAFAGEHGYDMGVGLEVGTPSLFKTKICFRLNGTVNWSEIYKDTSHQWEKYSTIGVSIVYNTFAFEHGRGRIYFDLGTYLEFPGSNSSARQTVPGIRGSTGIELFVAPKPNPKTSYFCSIGYSQAYAEKPENQLHYAKGFLFSTGFRFYL